MKTIPHNNLAPILDRYALDRTLTFRHQQAIATQHGVSLRDVEIQALSMGITPLRYLRNRKTIDTQRQQKLLESHVAIIGCGGLGGHVAEMLTRIGVGHLTLIDPDYFDEHNLNRQNFATLDVLDEPKVHVLERALVRINPVIRIRPIIQRFDPDISMALVTESDVVVDALDNPDTKLKLAAACQSRSLPFVHGAVAGMDGQLAVNATLEHLYPDGTHGAEDAAGNLPFTVAYVAAMQAAETVKLILGMGAPLTGQVLITDLLYNDCTRMEA